MIHHLVIKEFSWISVILLRLTVVELRLTVGELRLTIGLLRFTKGESSTYNKKNIKNN
jgi:hypothetical protein